MKKAFVFLIIGIAAIVLALFSFNGEKNLLIQIPNTDYPQSMGYIIHSGETTLVVDGGSSAEEPALIEQIKKVSGDNEVDGWFLTHYHKDHTGALAEYLTNGDDSIEIKNIYYDFPDEQFVAEYEPGRLEDLQTINAALDGLLNLQQVADYDMYDFSDISVSVLHEFESDIMHNAGNNSSAVYKVMVGDTSILFLGDLGVEGQEALLLEHEDEIRNMDYVQMAHHGQAGVSEEVYQIIDPEYCLWPTPQWLWDNETGEYQTLETRAWIEKLNVKKNYVAKDGLIVINLP